MFWVSIATAALVGSIEVDAERFRLEHRPVAVAGVTVGLEGYAYALATDDERCVGIAVEGRSNATLPTSVSNTWTYHDLDRVFLFDREACDWLTRPEPFRPEDEDELVVVVKSKKRDRSLARLRASLRDRRRIWEDWAIAPLFLRGAQVLMDIHHRDETGRIESEDATGWSTLVHDPYEQVEIGASGLVLESARGGAPRVVHRVVVGGDAVGAVASRVTLNTIVEFNGPAHLLQTDAAIEIRCEVGPCDHLSLLLPVGFDERPNGMPAFDDRFELIASTLDGEPVEPVLGAFGRSTTTPVQAYWPVTLPLPGLATGARAVVRMTWRDQIELTHPMPLLDNPTKDPRVVEAYAHHLATHTGPEHARPHDRSRPRAMDARREGEIRFVENPLVKRATGARPRAVTPRVVGQRVFPEADVRVVGPPRGSMPVYVQADERTRSEDEPRLTLAKDARGGPWIGVGPYRRPFTEGDVSILVGRSEQAPIMAARIRAFHEIASSQLGPRAARLAFFEGPMIGGFRHGYGAAPGVGWISPVASPDEDGLPESADRALAYSVVSQWFDRPTATLEPWMGRAFVELYTDLVFEGVHKIEKAGKWRRSPDPYERERFAGFGLQDWPFTQQVVYSARALELVRMALKPQSFNAAVRLMLESDEAISAASFERRFRDEPARRLIRDALVHGICPDIEVAWSYDRVDGTHAEITSSYTNATFILPMTLETKGDERVTRFVKIREGKGSFDQHPRDRPKLLLVDPHRRLPLCDVEVREVD